MKIDKNKLMMSLVLIVLLGAFAYGYTQYSKKAEISAVVQYKVDLSNAPEHVYAISLSQQTFSGGTTIKKGTRFIGKLDKRENGYVIFFDMLQEPNGETKKIIAKSNLGTSVTGPESGISAKIGKTLYKQTKTNVLGAIFRSSQDGKEFPGVILPSGSPLKIEID